MPDLGRFWSWNVSLSVSIGNKKRTSRFRNTSVHKIGRYLGRQTAYYEISIDFRRTSKQEQKSSARPMISKARLVGSMDHGNARK